MFFSIQKKKAFLSDVNSELINAYGIVKERPEELIGFLKTLEYSEECYYGIRSWDREL